MNEVIQYNLFDPMVCFISRFEYSPCGTSSIAFTLPPTFNIDTDACLIYLDDPTVQMTAGTPMTVLSGKLKDSKLSDYLYNKMNLQQA